jgi:hypothetical protein
LGQRACQHAQLGIPETAHGPSLEHHQLPNGSITHSLTHLPQPLHHGGLRGAALPGGGGVHQRHVQVVDVQHGCLPRAPAQHLRIYHEQFRCIRAPLDLRS